MPVMQSDLFDVEYYEQINENLVQQKTKKAREEVYNSQELPYFENPKDDSERLFNLQYRYLKNGDEEARKE